MTERKSMQLVPAVLALLVSLVLLNGYWQSGLGTHLPLALLFLAVSVVRVRRWRRAHQLC